MIISTGSTKVGVPLPSAYRKPLARAALASFLRRAGVDLPLPPGPGPARAGRPIPRRGRADPVPAGGAGGPVEGPACDVADHESSGYHPPSVRVTGRAMAWVTLAAFSVTAAIGFLRLFY